jgi:hypothetical protein
MTVVNEHPAADQSGVRRVLTAVTSRYQAVALVLLVVHALVAWLARAPGILLGHNDAMYVLLGESLRTFTYREVWYANTPPHAMYPPVYPAILGTLQALNGNGFNWLISANVLASTVALGLLFDVVRRWRGAGTALLCLAALAVNPLVVSAAGTLGAETQMILAVALVLWALAHEERGTHMSVIAAAGAIAAALLRTAAVPLVATVALYWLSRRRYRAVTLFAAACLLTVGAWLLWSAVAPHQAPGRSYVADAMVRSEQMSLVQNLATRISGHVARYASIVYWSLPMPTLRGTPLDNWLGVPLIFGALAAGIVTMMRTWRPAALLLVLYGALLAVWPYIEDRFLVPVLPVLVIAAVVGITVAAQLRAPAIRIVAAAVFTVLLATGAVWTSSAVAKGIGCDRSQSLPSASCLVPGEAGFFEAVRYIREHTAPDAVFLSAKPATLYYYTGRRSVIRELAARQSPDTFLPLLKEYDAQYLLLGSLDYMERDRFAPLIQANCRSLQLAASLTGGVYLFRVPAGTASGDGGACDAMETYYRTVKGTPAPPAPERP